MTPEQAESVTLCVERINVLLNDRIPSALQVQAMNQWLMIAVIALLFILALQCVAFWRQTFGD